MSTGTIEIYCDDGSHEGNRWVVVVLARAESNWHAEYVPDQPLTHTGSVVQWLAVPGAKGPARPRYRFRCKQCGRCVESTDPTEALDTLASNGIESISLKNLAAILK